MKEGVKALAVKEEENNGDPNVFSNINIKPTTWPNVLDEAA